MPWRMSALPRPHPLTAIPALFCPQSANDWVTALQGRPFLGGDKPDLADLAVFGVVRAVTGTDTFNDLMQARWPCYFCCWVCCCHRWPAAAVAAAPDRRCCRCS